MYFASTVSISMLSSRAGGKILIQLCQARLYR